MVYKEIITVLLVAVGDKKTQNKMIEELKNIKNMSIQDMWSTDIKHIIQLFNENVNKLDTANSYESVKLTSKKKRKC